MNGFFRKRFFIFFLIPGTLLYTALVIYPIFSAMRLSLFRWNGINPRVFVGFGNYIELFTDPYLIGQFSNALGNSIRLFLLSVFIQIPLQLAIAYLIYSKMKAHQFAQAVIFAPQFITTPVIVFIFRLLLDDNVGVVNNLLRGLGLDSLARPWLGIPGMGVFFMYLMASWGGLGVGMTFFVGAMNMVNRDGIEAAYINGAGYWTRLVRVIFPQIRITVINMVLVGYIYAMTMFDFSYVLGGTTGGINGSIDIMALFFYRTAFGDSNPAGGKLTVNSMGMGTTVACVLFFLIFVVALLQIIFLTRGENTE
jgi:ABC-type sugar transport system permease subunit